MFHYLIKHKFLVSLFITSFLPLWLSISLIELFSIFDSNNQYKTTEYIVLASIIVVNLLCLIYLNKKIAWFIKNQKSPSRKIVAATKEKSITTEYLLSCILPLFAFDFTNWQQVILFLVFFATLSFLCLRNNNVYSNIYLELKKYNFYTCEIVNKDNIKSNVLVISKNNLSKYPCLEMDFARINDEVFLDTTSNF